MNASASKCHKAMPNRGALVTGFVTGCDCHTTPLRVRDRWTITAVLPGNHADRAVTRTCVKSVTGRPRGTLAGALSRCHTPFKGVTALRPHVPVAKSHDGVQPRPDQRARSKRKRPATNPRESGPPILAARRAYARAILTELRTNFEEEGLDEWASSEDEEALAGINEAMAALAPVCAGDPRFTSDASRGDRRIESELFETCRGCPLLEACDSFAEATRPAAGYWAGRWRGQMPRSSYLAELRSRVDAQKVAEPREHSPVGVTKTVAREGSNVDHFPRREVGKGSRS